MTLKTNQTCRSDELFFFLSLGLFLLFTILSTSLYYPLIFGTPFQLMYLVCVALLALQEVHYTYDTRRELVGAVAALVLFAIPFLVAKGALQRSAACTFLFVYCGRRIPFRKTARFVLAESAVLVAFIILSSKLGLIENHVDVGWGRKREYLGFRYALFPAAHLLNLTALWIYLHRKKLPLTGAVILGLVNYWVYEKTDSRMSFGLVMVLLAAAVVLRLFPRILEKLRPLRWLMAFSFPICFVISMVLTAGYDPSVSWMYQLNIKLSHRLSYGQDSLKKYGFGLMGQQLEWVGNGLDETGKPPVGVYDYVDCLYVKLLQNYGAVFMVIFLLLLTAAMICCCRRGDDHLLLIMTAVAAHCMLDDLSIYLYYNTFWLAMGLALMNPEALYPAREPELPAKRRQFCLGSGGPRRRLVLR